LNGANLPFSPRGVKVLCDITIRVSGVRVPPPLPLAKFPTSTAFFSDRRIAIFLAWTGIGRARSGWGAAIVGDSDQVFAKLNRNQDMGIAAFILSGYSHAAEADLFARHVLPKMMHEPLVL
jgi:alkanesulfonate monooxygenase SsuD/methylene tetrahydromethanopterin reductase-like flavin-dependent oxidoreductase (luciferase family)